MNRLANQDELVFSIKDLQREGTKKLSKTVAEYYNEGSMDLLTLNDNTMAFDRVRLRPRVCVDVSEIDTSTKCFGAKVAMPLGFSPAAMHKLAHPEGELATSRAAAKAGCNMILSTWATTHISDVVKEGEGYSNAYGMQLSMVEDWQTNIDVVRNAEKAGCKALFLTVDCAVLGRRLNEYRNGFSLPKHLQFPNLPEGIDPHCSTVYDPRRAYDRSFTWEKVKRLVASTTMQVYLKGILTAEDAILAADCGAHGIVVSNHGGRQLDGAMSTLDALEEIVAAVKGRIQIHLDGGIRRGSDIFKAIALGADHCWVGRIPIWGLAYDGERGVTLGLNLLQEELTLTMALCGCSKLSDITPGHLARLRANGLFAKL